MTNKLSLLTTTLVAIILTSCSVDKHKLVQDTVDDMTKISIEDLNKKLADNFVYFNGKIKMDKKQFLALLDSSRQSEPIFKIIDLSDLDSIITTTEIQSSTLDSLLEVSPLQQVKKSYSFEKDRIKCIRVDTVLNDSAYNKSYWDKFYPFSLWTTETYPDKYGSNTVQFFKDEINLAKEYSKLSKEEKQRLKIRSYLRGTFVCSRCLYAKLEFKGKSTVTVYDGFIGFPFATSYVIDENYIRISTDKSDLLLKVVDSETLQGEGFAEGTFKKVKK